MIFGDEGLVTADDSICFIVKSEKIETMLRDSTKFSNYVENKLKPNLTNQVIWKNNNSESLVNQVFKRAIDWKSKSLLYLVDILTPLIEAQYKGMRRGRWCQPGSFGWPNHTSNSKCQKQYGHQNLPTNGTEITNVFVVSDLKTKNVTSTNGQTTIVKPRSLGKNLDQRKDSEN